MPQSLISHNQSNPPIIYGTREERSEVMALVVVKCVKKDSDWGRNTEMRFSFKYAS